MVPSDSNEVEFDPAEVACKFHCPIASQDSLDLQGNDEDYENHCEFRAFNCHIMAENQNF